MVHVALLTCHSWREQGGYQLIVQNELTILFLSSSLPILLFLECDCLIILLFCPRNPAERPDIVLSGWWPLRLWGHLDRVWGLCWACASREIQLWWRGRWSRRQTDLETREMILPLLWFSWLLSTSARVQLYFSSWACKRAYGIFTHLHWS